MTAFIKIAIVTAGLLAFSGCVSDQATYESWEYSRIQNCKLLSPYDSQLERCIEQAKMPYDQVEELQGGAQLNRAQ